MSGAQDPQPDNSAQSGGYAAADSSWWNGWGNANSSYWSWPGQQWSSYGGNGWLSHGSDKWQSGGGGSQWSEDAWKAKQWGDDSDAWQKDRREESYDARPAGVTAESREDNETARRQSTSTMEDDPWTAEGTGSIDDGSSTKGISAKASGKDFIPEYDGSTPMREYQRRVRLFEFSTGIDPTFRAQKLMEKLTGNAWLATESISLETLKHAEGVNRLLEHLWRELEPLEFLRTFQTLADFYKGFRRTKGQEFVAYDMEFRRHGQRLEEIKAGISGVTKAYWFLEKAGLSSELRKQVVAAAGGQYDYNKLRAAVMAIVPQVHKEEEHGSGSGHQPGRQWRKAPAKVHATVQEEDESGTHGDGDGEDEDLQPEALEEELQCLLTQAAKKRAQVEKARGFSNGAARNKNETPEARAKRIAELEAEDALLGL